MATTEQFSLRWNNFHSNLTSGFHELLEAAEMVDVTLAVEGRFLQAHKVVLSICSPYFKQMFKVNPCKHPIVILNDLGHENMKDILQFMYMGEVSVLREHLSSFLRAAEILQVKGLTGDDPTDDPPPEKKSIEMIDPADREIFKINEAAKQQSEMNMVPQIPAYAHTPPQTSPVPLTKRQLKPTNLTTSASKRSKCVEPVRPCVMSNYDDSCSEMTRDLSKPNIEYNSCDYSEPQNLNAHQSLTQPNLSQGHDGLKDLSTKCAIITPTICPDRPWDARIDPAGLTTMASLTTCGSVASLGSMDLSGSDQGTPEKKKTIEKTGFRCEHCCKKFTRRDHLRTHEKNIHGADAGPFKCVICEQLYKNTESLRKHISKFHFTNLNELVSKVEVKT